MCEIVLTKNEENEVNQLNEQFVEFLRTKGIKPINDFIFRC